MSNQTEEAAAPTAQMVGNAFIQQYYLALHRSPDVAHKFYLDSSVLTRPGPDGVMTSVTSMEEINKLILSLNYQNYQTEILTADAQYSNGDGVMVLVTGYLTRNNYEKRIFAQTFFLGPQQKSYFVLNDLFRFIDESTDASGSSPTHSPKPTVESSLLADDPVLCEITSVEVVEKEIEIVDSQKASISDKDDVAEESFMVEQSGQAEENVITEKSVENLCTDNVLAEDSADNIIIVDSVESNQNVACSVTEAAVPNHQEDAPKKSFASVVNALNKNKTPFQLRAPLPKHVEQARVPVVVQEAPAPVVNSSPEKNSNNAAAKAYAIFVANLPMSATVEELGKLFQQFGPIKHDGIQVRSSKGTCFGFVEFESASSMQSALEASPIVFANRKLSVEERRANNDRRNTLRSRDNYNGGNRRYGRGEFSGRARGGGRNGDSYQKPYSNGGEKVAQPTVKVA
ncbi:nuclear transport factor 2 isoform X2 [Humulus lupulus]|uniref:nuclear transport factor 2 isoform X2 n=1 Tax=Humulus lupulus TaxID=3486 RepID=UPI002B41305B|nr:nuclear transport factor 2 isoform X2 [Humulus lupulus]